ncbi:MAG: hypothetical protein J6B11_02690 [Spirochaetales bacterium]|nr:hypothetical protein [Spirochaetales bacterium]
MKRLIAVLLVLVGSVIMSFAEGNCSEHGYYYGDKCPLHPTTSESRSFVTTKPNGWDDKLPYWENNTTTRITDYSDGSRTVTTTTNRTLDSLLDNGSAGYEGAKVETYSPSQMRALGGNSYEPQAPNEAWLPESE